MSNYDNALNSLVTKGYDFNFSAYIHGGLDLYKKFMAQFAGFYIIVLAISYLSSFIAYLGLAIDFVLLPVFTAGALLVANELIKDKTPSFNFFFKGFDFIVPLLILNIVSGIIIILGFVLFIIPGIYLVVSYSIANMLILFLKYDYWSAMEWSRKIITKNWWKFLGFFLILGMINMAGFLFCGIGIIFTLPATVCMQFCAFEDIIGGAIRNQHEEQNSDYQKQIDNLDGNENIEQIIDDE